MPHSALTIAFAAVSFVAALAGPLEPVRAPRPRAAAPAARATVAVLAFDNNTGVSSLDDVGKGLAAMMTTDLAAVEELQLVEREKMTEIVAELDRQRTKYFDPSTAVAIGKLVGAEYMVAGSFIAYAPQLRIDTRIFRVATGEVVKSAQVTGRDDEFFELQQRLVRELVTGLGVALDPPVEAAIAARQATNRVDDLSVLVDVSDAIALTDRGEYVDAGAKMVSALRAAPTTLVVVQVAAEIRRRQAEKGASKVRETTRKAVRDLFRRPPR